MNWFDVIWQWFVENKEVILGWLTSANISGLGVAGIALYKQFKSVKENTLSTNALKDTLNTYNELSEKFTKIISVVNTIADGLQNFKNVLSENLNTQDKIITKLDAVLNVQQIAYSKMKDETSRNAIDNIVVNAKYTDEGTRADLLNEIARLKAKGTEMAEQYQKLINETSVKIKEVTEPEKEVEKKESVSRY